MTVEVNNIITTETSEIHNRNWYMLQPINLPTSILPQFWFGFTELLNEKQKDVSVEIQSFV